MEPAVPSSFTEKWCNTIQNMMNRQSPFEKSNIEWWLEVPNGTDNGWDGSSWMENISSHSYTYFSVCSIGFNTL